LDDEHPAQGSLVLEKPAERAELISPLGNAVAIWDAYSPSPNLLCMHPCGKHTEHWRNTGSCLNSCETLEVYLKRRGETLLNSKWWLDRQRHFR
jgi:hypothetical protein